MKRVLQVAVALLLMAGVANAQTPTTPAVDLNRAIFVVLGAGHRRDGRLFYDQMRQGNGLYTMFKQVPATEREYPVNRDQDWALFNTEKAAYEKQLSDAQLAFQGEREAMLKKSKAVLDKLAEAEPLQKAHARNAG